MKPALYLTLASVLLLGACSSDDDSDMLDTSDNDASGDTSELAPDGGETELSSTPGGDTSAIAGYWDGSEYEDGERYYLIAENGLWTEYFLNSEGDSAGNCYTKTDTQTLTPENPAANEYSLADGRALAITSDEARTTLTVDDIIEDSPTQTWPVVTGRMPEDLPLCTS